MTSGYERANHCNTPASLDVKATTAMVIGIVLNSRFTCPRIMIICLS